MVPLHFSTIKVVVKTLILVLLKFQLSTKNSLQIVKNIAFKHENMSLKCNYYI